MGMRIISNRDKDGKFISAADYWQPDKVEELLKKYNPKGTFHYSPFAKQTSRDKTGAAEEK